MNLKQAFQLQNVYGNWLNTALGILRGHSMITTETHRKSKALEGAIDETIVKSIADVYEGFDVNDVIHFIESLLSEKEKLTGAIFEAKARSEFDVDGCLAMNKTKQLVAEQLKVMKGARTTTVKTTGRDYCFDAEKKQGSYQYPVETVVAANFNKKEVAAVYQRLMRECEDVSTRADELKITAIVNYETNWTVDMSFEEAIQQFMGVAD